MRKLKELLSKTFYVPGIKLKGIRWPTITIPSLDVTLPRIGRWSPSLKLPRMELGLDSIRIPGSAGKILASAIVVSIGVGVFAMAFGVSGVKGAPSFPQPGLYTTQHLSSDDTLNGGIAWEDTFQDETTLEEREVASMTLALTLTGRAGDITLENLDVGAPAGTQGITESIKISGTATNTKYLECDEVYIQSLSGTKITVSNSEFFEILVHDSQADGSSIHATLSDVSDIEVQSLRGAYSVPSIKDSTFDRIIISGPDAFCRKLSIISVKSYGFPIVLDYIKAGKLTLSGRFGSGDGIQTPDLNIANTVKTSSMSVVNVTESKIHIR